MARTTLRLALLIVLAVGVSVGTTGFSTVDADRPVSMSVVDDDEAYVGVVACENPNDTANDNYSVHLWVENRNSAQVTVDAVTTQENGDSVDKTVKIDVGDRERFEVAFADEVTSVTVDVDGDGLDASVTREVASKADCPYSTVENGTATATATE